MVSLKSRIRRSRSERGAELIELAFALPVLMLVVAGIVEFGFLFREFEILTNAAREGARLGTLPAYGAGDITARVEDYATSSGLSGTVTVNPQDTTIPVGATTASAVQVDVSYQHPLVILGPIAGLFGGSYGTVTLTASSTMRKEGS